MTWLTGAIVALSVVSATVGAAASPKTYSETGSQAWGECAVNTAPVAVSVVSGGPTPEWNTDPDDSTLLAAQRLMALCSPTQDVERQRRDPNWRRMMNILRRAKSGSVAPTPATAITLRCVESLDDNPFRYDVVRRTDAGDSVVHRREFVYAGDNSVPLPGGLRAALRELLSLRRLSGPASKSTITAV